MSSVDSRIVTMKFDNAEFQKGVSTTMSTLDKLKASLSFSNIARTATQPLGLMATALSKIGLTNPFAKTKQGLDEVSTGTSAATKGLSGISGVLSKFGITNPFSKTKQGLDICRYPADYFTLLLRLYYSLKSRNKLSPGSHSLHI